MDEQFPLDLDKLAENIERSRERHAGDEKLDNFFFNYGTVAILFLTLVAAFLEPGAMGLPVWLPRAMSALAAILVGLERSLSFGQRWRFHIEQENGYQMVLDKITFVKLVPEAERPALLKDIKANVEILRAKESKIVPVDGGVNQSTPPTKPTNQSSGV